MTQRTQPTTTNNSRSVPCLVCGADVGNKCSDKHGYVLHTSHRARTARWRIMIGDSLDERERIAHDNCFSRERFA